MRKSPCRKWHLKYSKYFNIISEERAGPSPAPFQPCYSLVAWQMKSIDLILRPEWKVEAGWMQKVGGHRNRCTAQAKALSHKSKRAGEAAVSLRNDRILLVMSNVSFLLFWLKYTYAMKTNWRVFLLWAQILGFLCMLLWLSKWNMIVPFLACHYLWWMSS